MKKIVILFLLSSILIVSGCAEDDNERNSGIVNTTDVTADAVDDQ